MKSLLYVDDEPINLQLMKLNLRKNYIVHTAESGPKGLEILSTNNDISIVISDMKMPIMSGLDFIRFARSKYDHIVYFILSGFEINDDIQKALNNGDIAHYFQKPLKIMELEKLLQSS